MLALLILRQLKKWFTTSSDMVTLLHFSNYLHISHLEYQHSAGSKRRSKIENEEGLTGKNFVTTAEYRKIMILNTSEIVTRPLKKLYRCVNTKGVIDTVTSVVYPYGFSYT